MDIIDLEDEIEYFRCLPFSFTTELLKELESSLLEIFDSNHLHQKVASFVLDSFKRNMFIFNNFVLRNILKFPAHFRLERKVVDKVIHTDPASLISKMSESQLRLFEMRQKLENRKGRLKEVTNRNLGYLELLKNKDSLMELCCGSREIKKFLKETNSLLEKYKCTVPKKEGEFNKLMDYKNIKSEFYKNERNGILEISNFESMEDLLTKL